MIHNNLGECIRKILKHLKEMTKVQSLIKEISKLNSKDLEIILQEILHRMDRRQRLETALDNFIGKGQGVWELDAQDYIRTLREDDRL